MADSPVIKAISILKFLAARGSGIGVQQVARGVSLNVSTVHRLLQMLAADGMINYNVKERSYEIGPECIRLATQILGRHSLVGRVRPHIAALAADLHETCAFTIFDPKTASKIVAVVERSSHALGYDFDVGSRDGIHAGASGKPILAFLPDDHIEKLLRKKLPKLTEFTIVDPKKIRDEIVQIRKQGYATSLGERIPGAGVGIGAPVFSSAGQIVGSVVVTIPSFRWKPGRRQRVANRVMAAAEDVSSVFDAGTTAAGDEID